MVAILVRNGKVVDFAVNRFHHAEDALIHKGNVRPGDTVLVYRFKKDKSLGSSKPCSSCRVLLVQAGVEMVTFVDIDDTTIVSCDPTNIMMPKASTRYPAYRFAHRGGPADMVAA